jgi:ferrous iron transport protein B
MPCVAAVGAMKSQLGSWKDTAKAISYQCVLAYVISLIVYQFATIFFGGGPEWWIIPAVIALAGLVYILVSKEPFGFIRRAKDA